MTLTLMQVFAMGMGWEVGKYVVREVISVLTDEQAHEYED